MVKALLKKLANRFGYDLLHLPTDPLVRRRLDLLKKHRINLIFDVGANTGQFALNMRKLGYKGQIVSFEPLPDAFKQLAQNAEKDSLWDIHNTAIGNQTGKITIHVAQNSYSSSILDILPAHVESAPDSVYTGTVDVPITTIDSVIDQYYQPGKKLYIKIDTQGYERQVLEGCKKSFQKITGFQMELSLVPLYAGETLMQEMIEILKDKGYVLQLIESGHLNYTTGEILQVEGYFFKK